MLIDTEHSARTDVYFNSRLIPVHWIKDFQLTSIAVPSDYENGNPGTIGWPVYA